MASEQKQWTVYILSCSDGSLYTGITLDINRRVSEHNLGKGARYTRSRRPVVLVYSENHANRSLATARELAIKAMSHAEKLMLAKCRYQQRL